MRALIAATLLFLFLSTIEGSVASAHEFSGYAAVEGRYFFQDPLFPEQERNNASLALQPEYYHEFESGSSITFTAFGRLDSADSERTHFDIRELNYLWLGNPWELRVGIGKVFWGVTEFVHLVDIINQTDLVEAPDGEEKLGQPVVSFSYPTDWGTLDLFVLPYFRERTFPGSAGRLRTALVVDTGNAIYESDKEQNHVDFAVRYSRSLGDWEIGLSYFTGTSREPTLLPDLNKSGEPVLIPFYEQINQGGLDLQLITGSWLWKLEAIYRTGQSDADFFSSDFGFEYTFYGVFSSPADVGVLAEYLFDDRGNDATTAFENDVAIGVRLSFNDAATSEALLAVIQDVETSARLVTVEASRRFGSNVKANLEIGIFSDIPFDDPLYSLRKDSFLRLEMAYYF
jgi:hypothetical protein